MKRIFILIVIAVMIAVCCVSLIACNKSDGVLTASDANLGNYDEANVVEGMSAYDLIMEAYKNWIADENYVREEYFKFSANKGVIATRDSYLVRKVVGDKIYSQEIIYGQGLDSGSCAKRYYFDGQNAYYLNNTDKGDLIKDEAGNLSTKEWGTFTAFEGDVEKENYSMTQHLTTYDFSTRDNLSANHNDKVYLVDGVYYCTMTLDCSIEAMTTVHKAAFEEFLDMTGAKEEGFTIEDTTIDFAIAEIDGKMKFLIWKRNEKYSGKHATVPIPVSCEQTCLSYYSYGEAVITNEDLLNLA